MSSADNKKDKKDKKKEKKEKKAKREREEANLHHVTGRQWMLEEERKAEQNETFVWGAKREKLIQQGLTPEQMAQEQERTRLERLAELEKIKALRAQRDLEAELFEQEKRRAESANFSYNGWLEEERQFHLKQAKERAEIRLKEGRPKPIDILAKNLEVDLKYDFHMQPFQMLQGLSEPQLQDLATDIDMYVELMPEAKEFWSALKLLCSEQIAILTGKRAPVSRDILDVFNGQSLEELLELQTNIAAQMEEGEDPEYWDALDKRCAVEIAKTKLAKIHAEKLQERLAQMDEKNREEERLRLEAVLRNKMEAGQVTASNAAAAALSAPSSSAPVANDEALAGASAAAPRVRRREKLVLDEIEEIGGEEGDELARQDERIRELMEETRELDNMMIRGGGGGGDEVDFDGAQTGVMLSEHELMQLERDRPEEENEEIFADEVETQNLLAVPAWQDKFAPRKPKYFNRVKTGYEWNKYNSTHYSAENPPPKVVHGYRFNLFYPDLVNPSVSPTFKVENIPGNSDWQILRFRAGPPYLDVAFKIVKKDWERDSKYGYKAVFERGVLRLYFTFRRTRYKR